jgi:predicted O-linked N-acetylglucosamine transferase (SPINDLY family)
LPTAHIVIDSSSFKDASVQQAAVDKFTAHGIATERLHIGFNSPPWDVLRGIDIGLDCFPHNSGTTLFETLYMGLPFVTLARRPSVGRIGSAILEGIGHPEWIAQTEDEYVDKVVALAADLPALAHQRATLRQQMRDSRLMDEVGFARNVEQAYAQMFQRWERRDL